MDFRSFDSQKEMTKNVMHYTTGLGELKPVV